MAGRTLLERLPEAAAAWVWMPEPRRPHAKQSLTGLDRLCVERRPRAIHGLSAHLLFIPEQMVRLGPIDVDLSAPHPFECALHAKRAHVDVHEHGCDVEDTHNAVYHLGRLHAGDSRQIERKEQDIARDRHHASTDDHGPENEFLTRVE